MINYISHKKSKQIVNGLPKLPTADQLKEGEIAINYANGYETLSIKNSNNEIITFSSTEQFEKYVDTTIGNKLGSGFTSGNSANTVTSVIESNEKVVSAALNELNDRITQLQTTVDSYKTRIEALESKNSSNASQG